MPAENDPAEPKALTQSLQLTCSLMPSSTVPSTRFVIIWLKRCLARSLIDPPLESAPVGLGLGLGVGVGVGEAMGVGVGVGVGVGEPAHGALPPEVVSATENVPSPDDFPSVVRRLFVGVDVGVGDGPQPAFCVPCADADWIGASQ